MVMEAKSREVCQYFSCTSKATKLLNVKLSCRVILILKPEPKSGAKNGKAKKQDIIQQVNDEFVILPGS